MFWLTASSCRPGHDAETGTWPGAQCSNQRQGQDVVYMSLINKSACTSLQQLLVSYSKRLLLIYKWIIYWLQSTDTVCLLTVSNNPLKNQIHADNDELSSCLCICVCFIVCLRCCGLNFCLAVFLLICCSVKLEGVRLPQKLLCKIFWSMLGDTNVVLNVMSEGGGRWWETTATDQREESVESRRSLRWSTWRYSLW